jgi:hypothetical protein
MILKLFRQAFSDNNTFHEQGFNAISPSGYSFPDGM